MRRSFSYPKGTRCGVRRRSTGLFLAMFGIVLLGGDRLKNAHAVIKPPAEKVLVYGVKDVLICDVPVEPPVCIAGQEIIEIFWSDYKLHGVKKGRLNGRS